MTGIVVWFTGLPASGKTTLARRVRAQLPAAILLDSDELRDVLAAGDYGAGDRARFYAVVGRLAAMLAAQDHVVLVAATASRRTYRDAARVLAPRFLEVWVRTPLAACEARDVKGLYARARAGDAPTLPGIGEPYEAPDAAEIVADGGHDEVALAAVLAALA
jgi:adenylylsulfate kinase